MTMRPPPTRVPTLTEVVDLSLPEAPAPSGVPAVAQRTPASTAAASAILEEDLVQGVLADLQRQIDLMLEVKLREALAPALTRVTDTLLREARTELASTLREIVARAVAQEIDRHRQR